MSDGIMLSIGEDGLASVYDDTYDITIHCESKEEQEEAIKALKNIHRWIPCSERLPENDGEYLVRPSNGVLEDYSDFREMMIMPYDSTCEAFGWWVDRFDPETLGFVDSDFNEFEVIAWMPLPEPYKMDEVEE